MENKNSPTSFSSKYLRFWIISLRFWFITFAVIIVLGAFGLLAFLNNPSETTSNYGVFLDKGLLDDWEFNNGRASFTLEDDLENFKDYKIYISDQIQILKAMWSQNGAGKQIRSLQPGNLSEIQEGIFVEIYLQNSYNDITRTATTIIYWE